MQTYRDAPNFCDLKRQFGRPELGFMPYRNSPPCSSAKLRYNAKIIFAPLQFMSEGKNPVIDWDNTVHKNVRSKEGEPVGNVVAILGDSIHVETQGSRGQYMIPKENVAGFNGAEVTLNIAIEELGKFVR